jgi:hypothetical protein
MDNFKDEVNGQIDKRKVEKLVENGEFTLEELANAPILFQCECGCEQDLDNEFCEECGAET